MHAPDLSPYRYSASYLEFLDEGEISDEQWEQLHMPEIFHVGWLTSRENYPRGEVSHETRSKLARLCRERRVRHTFGNHPCEFCPSPPAHSGVTLDFLSDGIMVSSEGTYSGNGELWLPGPGRVIYAAPILIGHYVEEHGYRPPEPFLCAIDEFDEESSFDPEAECTRRNLLVDLRYIYRNHGDLARLEEAFWRKPWMELEKVDFAQWLSSLGLDPAPWIES